MLYSQILEVPNFYRSGIEEAECIKHPAEKGLPPGGRRLFCAVGFIPTEDWSTEDWSTED